MCIYCKQPESQGERPPNPNGSAGEKDPTTPAIAELKRLPQKKGAHLDSTILKYRPGKRLQSYGKSSFLMGKLIISTGPFSIASCNKLPEGNGKTHNLQQTQVDPHAWPINWISRGKKLAYQCPWFIDKTYESSLYH